MTDVIIPSGEQQNIEVAKIRFIPNALRDVEKDTVEFNNLCDSIRTHGLLNSISVTAKQIDPETKEEFYYLQDGRHRLEAFRSLGQVTIPARILETPVEDIILSQIAGNSQKIDTKPFQFSKALIGFLKSHPSYTYQDLANVVNKPKEWVIKRLGLVDLHPTIGELLDEGMVTLANAHSVKSLPQDIQAEFIEHAQHKTNDELDALVKERKADLAKARGDAPKEFTAKPHLRSFKEVNEEYSAISGSSTPGPAGQNLIATNRLQTAEEGWCEGVRWALNVDNVTLAALKKAFDEKKAADEQRRIDMAAARQQKSIAGLKYKADRQAKALALAEEGKTKAEIDAALAAWDEEYKAAEAKAAEAPATAE